MSIFDRLDSVVSGTTDAIFAVRFECHPTNATPNGRPEPDPAREPWDGKAILETNPEDSAIEIGKRDGTGNDTRVRVSGDRYELSVDRMRYPQADTAKQGDRIWLDDMRKFEVVSVRPDGLSRTVFALTRL